MSATTSTKPTSLEILRDRFKGKNKRGRKSDAERKFERAMKNALLLASETKEKIPKYRKLVIGNFLVNAVSIFEVYLKDLILQTKGWNEQGYAELLKDKKISLNEAFDVFEKDRITRQFMITHFYSFQSVTSIEHVFGCLTGEKHFLKEIGDVGTGGAAIGGIDFKTLDERFPDWVKELNRVYSLRNAFVHEGVQDDLYMQNIGFVFELMSFIEMSIDGFVYAKIRVAN